MFRYVPVYPPMLRFASHLADAAEANINVIITNINIDIMGFVKDWDDQRLGCSGIGVVRDWGGQ